MDTVENFIPSLSFAFAKNLATQLEKLTQTNYHLQEIPHGVNKLEEKKKY